MLKHMQPCALARFASPVRQPTFADRYQHEQQQNSSVVLSRNKTESAMRDDLLAARMAQPERTILDMETKPDTPQTPRSVSVLQHMCTKWVLDDRSAITI